jgi:preprotein translocase subunit SecD
VYVQDTARAKEILGAVATLEFRMVDEKNDPQTAIRSGRVPIGSKLYYFSKFLSFYNFIIKVYVLSNNKVISH